MLRTYDFIANNVTYSKRNLNLVRNSSTFLELIKSLSLPLDDPAQQDVGMTGVEGPQWSLSHGAVTHNKMAHALNACAVPAMFLVTFPAIL